MSEETAMENDIVVEAVPEGIGPQLRAAREAKGLSRAQLAAETRISSRHIENIEAGNFAALPGRTYAVGFSRTLAKSVGLDQDDVVAMVRAKLDSLNSDERQTGTAVSTFEPGDLARAPGGRLVWFSLFAVVLLLAGVFFTARVLFSPAAQLPSLLSGNEDNASIAETSQADADAASASGPESALDSGLDSGPDAAGAVVFAAEGEVWVRFFDAQNRVLSERTMQAGDSYMLPADAQEPRLMTGRPDLLAITIGGERVAKLSDDIVTLQAEPISAAALLARGQPPANGAAPAN